MTPVQALAALALVFPGSASSLRAEPVRLVVEAAERHHVPAPMLLAACWMESRLGTAPQYASLCGTRVAHVYVGSDALSADIAGRSLARRFGECGTWPRALVAYRWGLGCGAPDANGYAGRVLRMAQRIERRSR
jgi:hypothetical protein